MAKKEFAEAWRGFTGDGWKESVNVRDFIHNNYTPYEGDDSFLRGASSTTKELWKQVVEGIKVENSTHAPLDFDEKTPTSIVAHDAGYINKELEKIVGLQTDLPLKRAIFPYGGIRMVSTSCDLYGKPISKELEEFFTIHRKTHNQGVFDGYTPDIKLARKTGIITGLPDAYGRGRIIGDYRRVALYGIDFLMNQKLVEKSELDNEVMTEDVIRLREELSEQYRSLMQMKEMANKYGYDISNPARTAQEAIQYTYFGYLAAVKSQNGAAMSLGRVSTFLDIYLERDIAEGTLSEDDAQELIDHFVMKLRMVRFLRTPEYDQLFSGDPIWATESVGGMGLDGRTLVTKTSYRLLNTLYTMGASPEPNITVLWSEHLPKAWKRYCSKVSLDSSSIQYENDDLMRKDLDSDDYAIACCVSPMIIGKQMQFFGARANLAKTLLYAINGGKDEKMKIQVTPKFPIDDSEVLDFDNVYSRLDKMMDWLSEKYISALNIIHYMHDRYSYESALMALHDRDVKRMMACGIAGLSVTVDSLSAIKYATVKPIRDESGLVIDFDITGEFPTFGNNDDRVDSIAIDLVKLFMSKLRKYKTYRNSEVTQSILTITSNVVYGNKTGNTPDGRKAGTPFGPGANPMHCRDKKGAIASLNSVSKLPFSCAKDGISYTFSIVPSALGKTVEHEREDNLSYLLDGYFSNDNSREGGQHLNVNVLSRELLEDAVNHPENYPQLTIRVSGYAVRFNSLTAEQQQDVITRTFTESM